MNIEMWHCDKHFVHGFNRTTCPYCEDKENTYEPHTWTDGTSCVFNSAVQIKKKASEK